MSDISANNYYGYSIANIGDLDGDHIDDIAVGAVKKIQMEKKELFIYIL